MSHVQDMSKTLCRLSVINMKDFEDIAGRLIILESDQTPEARDVLLTNSFESTMLKIVQI